MKKTVLFSAVLQTLSERKRKVRKINKQKRERLRIGGGNKSEIRSFPIKKSLLTLAEALCLMVPCIASATSTNYLTGYTATPENKYDENSLNWDSELKSRQNYLFAKENTSLTLNIPEKITTTDQAEIVLAGFLNVEYSKGFWNASGPSSTDEPITLIVNFGDKPTSDMPPTDLVTEARLYAIRNDQGSASNGTLRVNFLSPDNQLVSRNVFG